MTYGLDAAFQRAVEDDDVRVIIAMVRGACIAGGLMLAWVCDLIVAADDATPRIRWCVWESQVSNASRTHGECGHAGTDKGVTAEPRPIESSAG